MTNLQRENKMTKVTLAQLQPRARPSEAALRRASSHPWQRPPLAATACWALGNNPPLKSPGRSIQPPLAVVPHAAQGPGGSNPQQLPLAVLQRIALKQGLKPPLAAAPKQGAVGRRATFGTSDPKGSHLGQVTLLG